MNYLSYKAYQRFIVMFVKCNLTKPPFNLKQEKIKIWFWYVARFMAMDVIYRYTQTYLLKATNLNLCVEGKQQNFMKQILQILNIKWPCMQFH